MPYLSCKKIENDVYNFPTWQYCKYKDIFDSRIIINSTAKFYISISYQKDLLSIDTRIFTPSMAANDETLLDYIPELQNEYYYIIIRISVNCLATILLCFVILNIYDNLSQKLFSVLMADTGVLGAKVLRVE